LDFYCPSLPNHNLAPGKIAVINEAREGRRV